MLKSPPTPSASWRRHLGVVALAAATVAASVLAAPGAASAAGNPQVLSVNPTTGVQKVLAGGAPWTTLGAIAVSGPSNTVYVPNQGPIGPSPQGAGIYSITGPSYPITAFVTGGLTANPQAIVANGPTLYSLDEDRIISINTSLPGIQNLVTSGGLYDTYGVEPQYGAFGANGVTLYTTASSSCASAEGGGAYIIAVNTLTGAQTLVKSLGCVALGGIAVTNNGALLIAEGDTNTADDGPAAPAKIVALNPSTGVVSTVSNGGDLQSPQGIVLNAAGDLLVADSVTGIVAVSPSTGQQSSITSGGQLSGATGIAVGSDNTIYVSEVGPATVPTMVASVYTRQKVSPKGIKVAASCSTNCSVVYSITVRIKGGLSYAQDGTFHNVGPVMTDRKIKLPISVQRRISTALNGRKKTTATITLTPSSTATSASGATKTLSLQFVKH